VNQPAVFVLEYSDGLRARRPFLMTGLVEDFTVAVDVEGRPKPVSTLMYLQERRPHHHFGCLVKEHRGYVRDRQGALPGRTDYAHQRYSRLSRSSPRIRGYKKLDTPELAKVRYQTGVDASHFCDQGWGPDGKRMDM